MSCDCHVMHHVTLYRHSRDIEEPEVVYEASDEESDGGDPLPLLHLLATGSDSERYVRGEGHVISG